MLLLPLSLAYTNRQCGDACRQEYSMGGRVATEQEKGEYGFKTDVDCTCVSGWLPLPSEKSCDRYCATKREYPNKYCVYVGGMCILHVGLVY